MKKYTRAPARSRRTGPVCANHVVAHYVRYRARQAAGRMPRWREHSNCLHYWEMMQMHHFPRCTSMILNSPVWRRSLQVLVLLTSAEVRDCRVQALAVLQLGEQEDDTLQQVVLDSQSRARVSARILCGEPVAIRGYRHALGNRR